MTVMNSSNSNNIAQNTWVFVWGMTPSVVGHVGIQVGGEKPGDPNGVYKSVHPNLPVFGPLIVYPVPVHAATSWQEDAESEGRACASTARCSVSHNHFEHIHHAIDN